MAKATRGIFSKTCFRPTFSGFTFSFCHELLLKSNTAKPEFSVNKSVYLMAGGCNRMRLFTYFTDLILLMENDLQVHGSHDRSCIEISITIANIPSACVMSGCLIKSFEPEKDSRIKILFIFLFT